MRRFAALAIACWIAACERSHEPPEPRPPISAGSAPSTTVSSAATPSPTSSPSAHGEELAPLTDAAWLERFEPEPGTVAYVAVPLGAREPRPVMIAVHGAGDRPEWACGGWRLASQAFAFVVCPQGSPSGGDRFSWPSPAAISRVIDLTLPALRARFGPYVAQGPMIYAGFSLGAGLAEPILLARASEFPLAIFAEGGYRTLENAAFARRYAERGGRRVMIVCGSPSCDAHGRRARAHLERAGLEVLTSGDTSSGHNLNEPMQRALRETWPELVRGLTGWEAYPSRRQWPLQAPSSGAVN